MIRQIKDKRILASEVLCADGIKGLSMIEILDDRVEVTPFRSETHSTVYVPYPVAVLRADVEEEFLHDEIAHAFDAHPHSSALICIHRIFLTYNLYHTSGAPLVIALR